MAESFVEDSITLTPKDIFLNRHEVHAGIDYWLEDNDSSTAFVSVGGKEPQTLHVEWQDITYGKRAYFRCTCERRATKLYLPSNGSQFKCRACHGLQYQLSTFNRRSVAGRSIYRLNRLRKLADSRASMGRILYKGNYTKRFERFLGLCDRAGLDSIVKGAEDLRALIKG